MGRRRDRNRRVRHRRPHARGDGPCPMTETRRTSWQAPRTWGWTVLKEPIADQLRAGPTHVGMWPRSFVPGLMRAIKPGGTRHGSAEEVTRLAARTCDLAGRGSPP